MRKQCCLIMLLIILSMAYPVHALPKALAMGENWIYRDINSNANYSESVMEVLNTSTGNQNTIQYAVVNTSRPYLNMLNMSVNKVVDNITYSVHTWIYQEESNEIVFSRIGGIPLYSQRSFAMGASANITFANGTVLSLSYQSQLHSTNDSDVLIRTCGNLHCVPFEDTFANGAVGTQEIEVSYRNETDIINEGNNLYIKYNFVKKNETSYSLEYALFEFVVFWTGGLIRLRLFDSPHIQISKLNEGQTVYNYEVSLSPPARYKVQSTVPSLMELTYDPVYVVPVKIVQKRFFPSGTLQLNQLSSPLVLELLREEVDDPVIQSVENTSNTTEQTTPYAFVYFYLGIVLIVWKRKLNRKLKVFN